MATDDDWDEPTPVEAIPAATPGIRPADYVEQAQLANEALKQAVIRQQHRSYDDLVAELERLRLENQQLKLALREERARRRK